MSGYVRPALITAIAESIGISDLSEEVSRVLAPDVEYRVRDILQVRRNPSAPVGCLACLTASCKIAQDSNCACYFHPGVYVSAGCTHDIILMRVTKHFAIYLWGETRGIEFRGYAKDVIELPFISAIRAGSKKILQTWVPQAS